MKESFNIVVVNDNKLLSQSFYESFSLTHEIIELNYDDHLMKKIQEISPDYVIINLASTDFDAFDLSKSITNRLELERTKIILIGQKTSLENKVKGFVSGAIDIIDLPINYELFTAKLLAYSDLIYDDHQQRSSNYLKDKEQLEVLYKVNKCLDNIIYINSESPYCKIVCKHCKFADNMSEKISTLRFRITIDCLQSYFCVDELLRVHRSFMINPKKIVGISKKGNREYKILMPILGNDIEYIPVGRSYQTKLKAKLPNWF
ncbi:MAG: LytTR family transcriptional regulator DNA-binding domain-containing protein [Deltaproteobacteria bacterium]|nr:LytTR family transcriptional regulator DNA-binding domain-containing protein [Deltaproteobacteria bacterium]